MAVRRTVLRRNFFEGVVCVCDHLHICQPINFGVCFPPPLAGHAYVINSTGGLRGEVATPFFIAAAISDDGNTLAIGDDGTIILYTWNASMSMYMTMGAPLAPPGGGAWICWDLQMAALPDQTPIAVVGWISGDVLDVRVTG